MANVDFATSLAARGVPAVYALPSNTQKIRSAMARTDRNAVIACVGPSTTRGITTGAGTAQFPNAWPLQAAAILQKQGINAGASNFFGDGGTGTTSGLAAADSRFAFTGGFATGAVNTLGGFILQASTTGTIVFTPTANVTKFDIYYRDGAAAGARQFSWAIDGGSATTVSNPGLGTLQKVTVSAGTAGLHALTIAWVAGTVFIVGVSGYDDTSSRREITFLNWGISGARSDQFIANTDTAGAGRISAWTTIAPDLTIIDDAPINDWRQGGQYTISAYLANLQTMFDTARLSGDVAMTTALWDNGTSGNSAQQSDYVAAGVALAMSNNVPIIDVRSAWVSYAAANGVSWYSDTVHPTALGYAVKAASIAEFVRRLKAM